MERAVGTAGDSCLLGCQRTVPPNAAHNSVVCCWHWRIFALYISDASWCMTRKSTRSNHLLFRMPNRNVITLPRQHGLWGPMFVMCNWNNLRRTATCDRRRLHTLVSYCGPRQAPKSITAHMCLPPSSPCFGKFANGTKVVTGFTAIPHVRPIFSRDRCMISDAPTGSCGRKIRSVHTVRSMWQTRRRVFGCVQNREIIHHRSWPNNGCTRWWGSILWVEQKNWVNTTYV